MLEIKIDKDKIELNGDAPEAETVVTCAIILTQIYEYFHKDILTFKEYMDIFYRTALNLQKEDNDNDHTCTIHRSFRKLS